MKKVMRGFLVKFEYGSEEMWRIFDQDAYLQRMLDVEAALAKAHAKVGNIPTEAAKEVSKKCFIKYVKWRRIREIDEQIPGHTVVALVKALNEVCERNAGEYVHLGATSSDILDTAIALQFKDTIRIIMTDLYDIEGLLIDLAEKYNNLILPGRTHGQHAGPITLGLKFALWAQEIRRHIQRLKGIKPRLVVGTFSGATGTQAAYGPQAEKIEKLALEELGLGRPVITDQVIQRDRWAEFTNELALLACTLEKIAMYIRDSAKTELKELEEPYDEKKGFGTSSAMPQKRNPFGCEWIIGLAKMVRGNALAVMETVAMEHERDETNMPCEQTAIPSSCLIIDEMLKILKEILSDLRVHKENMEKNLNLTKGLIMAEAVMMGLVGRGVGRQLAHEMVRRCAMEAYHKGVAFKEVLLQNAQMKRYLHEDDIDKLLDPRNYLGTTLQRIENVVRLTRDQRKMETK